MNGFVGPIKAIARGIYDGPHATPPEASSGPVFLGIGNVTTHGRLDLSKVRHVSEHDYPRWTRRVTPQADDIVFSYEATLHRYAIIPEGFRGCLGRRIALIRPDTTKVVPRFLHYYFHCNNWRSVVESNVISGATVDRIPLTRFPDFEVRIPEMETQWRISKILAAYDDLMENNRRRIQLLEQSARLLYKEWFVRLRFPGHEGVRVKDGVPEGWGMKTLGDLVEVAKGRNITKNSAQDGTVPVVAGGLSPAYFNDTANTVGPVITISASGANAGYINLYHEDIWASDCSYISSTATSCVYYLYFLLKSKQRQIFGFRKGAAQPHVYPKDLKRLPLLDPNKILVNLFEKSVAGNFHQVKFLVEQNKLLLQARDLLLPRLMSEEIKLRCGATPYPRSLSSQNLP